MADYSLTNLDERAQEAKRALEDRYKNTLAAYDSRERRRSFDHTPVVSFVGYGRAGKDTAAQFYCDATGLEYGGSTSSVMAAYVAHAAGVEEYKCFQERHQNRQFWLHFCNAFRKGEPEVIAKMLLAQSDVLVGVRGAEEFRCLVPAGVVDLHVWIDNPTVARDETVEFDRRECDLVIDNLGSLDEFRTKVERFARLVHRRP